MLLDSLVQSPTDAEQIVNGVVKEIIKTDMRNIYTVPDTPIGQFEEAESAFPALTKNIPDILKALSPDVAAESLTKFINDMEKYWAMTYYYWNAKKFDIEQKVSGNHMEYIVEVANKDELIRKVISGEIPCLNIEP